MNIEYINGFLEALGLLNNGSNHGASYFLEDLPDASNLKESLDIYFSTCLSVNNKFCSAEDWKIQIIPISENPQTKLENTIHYWFFETEFSPKHLDKFGREIVIDAFLKNLKEVIKDAFTFEIQVEPPIWYECFWHDFAFSLNGKFWLLHFGISD